MSLQPLAIWNAAKATLVAAQATGQPLNFVPANSLYDGIYTGVNALPPGSFPAIMMELNDDEEEWFTTGTPPAIRSKFKIYVSCLVRESKPNKGIIGDPTLTPRLVGLLEFVSIVKNVLQLDQTLGNTIGLQKVSFPKTEYFFQAYPIREARISVLLESQLTTTSH